MIRFTKYTRKIIRGDIIMKHILSRVKVSENDLITLLDYTYVIITILFDG